MTPAAARTRRYRARLALAAAEASQGVEPYPAAPCSCEVPLVVIAADDEPRCIRCGRVVP
jgi:hypothetical protein